MTRFLVIALLASACGPDAATERAKLEAQAEKYFPTPFGPGGAEFKIKCDAVGDRQVICRDAYHKKHLCFLGEYGLPILCFPEEPPKCPACSLTYPENVTCYRNMQFYDGGGVSADSAFSTLGTLKVGGQ